MRWPWVSSKRLRAAEERIDDLTAIDRGHRQGNRKLLRLLREETLMHQNERHEMFDAVKGLIDTWIDPTRHVSDLRPHLQKLHNMIYPKPDEVLDADPSKPPSQLHPEPVVSVKKGEHGVPVVTRSPSPLTGDPDEWTMGGGPPAAGPNTKVPIALLEVDEDGVLRGSSWPLPGGIDDA